MIGFLKIETDEDGNPESVEMVDSVPDDAAALLCVELTVPLILPDNHIGNCAGCGKAIQFRPVAVNVPKVCMKCAPDWVVGHANPQ